MKKILFFSICFIAIQSFAQKNKPGTSIGDKRFAGLDTTFEKILKDWHIAGFAVAVIEKDKIVYSKGVGFRDYEKKLPVTPNTQFAIGSCTKAFTSALLGIYKKEDKIDFDKPARTYLPDLKFFNDDMNNQITVRDMMCHRTGLPRHDFSWYLFTSKNRDSLLQRIQFQEPSAGIRQTWQYNNFMFLAQGMMTEKISKKTWEENVREKIFKPLGMTNSNFSVNQMAQQADAAIGYGLEKDSIIKKIPYYDINAMGPAGSINSSVTEMANWVITWINGGKFKGQEILPASYVTEAQSSQMIIGAALPTKELPDVHFSNYGMGWFLASYKGHYRVEHGGNIDGFSASTCFFPTDSIGIVVLTNQNGSAVTSIVRNIMADRMLGLPAFDWSTDRKKSAEKAKSTAGAAAKTASSNKKTGTALSHSLKDFEGLYHHPGYGNFDVFIQADSLFVHAGKQTWWLRQYHYDVFEPFDVDETKGIDTSDKSNLRLNFRTNDMGEISELLTVIEPSLPPLKFERKPKPKVLTKEDLKKYTGDYELSGATVNVYIKDDKTLVAKVPGQPDYELIPLGNDKFSLKVAAGFYIQFEVNNQQETTALTFMQPNGNFKATRKK